MTAAELVRMRCRRIRLLNFPSVHRTPTTIAQASWPASFERVFSTDAADLDTLARLLALRWQALPPPLVLIATLALTHIGLQPPMRARREGC